MRVKKIRAKNFREALTLVKRELGEDAVILSSDDRKGSNPYVEVTAAVDYDIETGSEAAFPAVTAVSQPDGPSEIIELKNELKGLRQSIDSMKEKGFELKLPDGMKKMFYFLKERSIKEEFALRLVERAHEIEDIEMLMTDDINVSMASGGSLKPEGPKSSVNARRAVMLIGPTGVGKTTTAAKLASQAIKEGKRVAMISLDTYKIGAAEQSRIYSRMIGVPLDIVSSVESLKNSMNRFSDKDLILMDTTGQNPREDGYIKGLNEICCAGLPIETHLLLSASSDCDFLMDTYRHYKSLPIDSIAFTKTDEAVKLGSIYNLCSLYQKPVAYITTGQRVPGNIEFVDSRKLTNLILTTGSA
jgi:flagellar biosynthesis protein FlhF